MKDFTYYTPTKVFFGKGVEKNVGETLYERGYRKVLLHFGGGSVKKSGLLDIVIDSLVSAGLSIVQLGGVEPNPKVELVREGIKLAKEQQVDCILAVGGGSVIDSAKGIALGLANDIDPWEMIKNMVPAKKGFPLSVVLTISAAGSEMSQSVVLSDSETYLKRGFNQDLCRPEFTFENPEYSYSVSPYQTACGIVDTMMHTLERYYTPDIDTELVDRISEGLIVAVKNAGTAVMADPDDYEARATLMWASSLSHNGLTGCGKQPVFPVHKLEHDISGLFDSVSHGAGLAVLFPAWAKFIYTHDVRKFAQGAVRMWGVEMDHDHPERTALRGIDAMRDYFASIGMPVTLGELGVPESSYEQLANMSTDGGAKPVKSYVDLGIPEILEIFALAK
jgi:alcohol dehydrogenase